MNDKSFVGIDHCPICGASTGIVIDQKVRDVFPRDVVTSEDPCDRCDKFIETGVYVGEQDETYIFMVQSGDRGDFMNFDVEDGDEPDFGMIMSCVDEPDLENGNVSKGAFVRGRIVMLSTKMVRNIRPESGYRDFLDDLVRYFKENSIRISAIDRETFNALNEIFQQIKESLDNEN